jgi:spermidine synthase
MDRRSSFASGILPVFLLFVFSGAAGLAYEVVWTRMLVRTFGASSFAVSTVLAAYMAGFALGSYLFGRLIDRKGNPVLIYGFLELGVGVFALVFPFLLAALNPVYRSLYAGLEGKLYALSLIRFVLSFAMLLVPTTLMGGTLPVLSRFVARSLGNLTFRVGWLYSINTFGAVAGTFVTGFVLLPSLGIRITTLAAAAANIAIFGVSLCLARRLGAENVEPEPGSALDSGAQPAAEPARQEPAPPASQERPAGIRYERIVLVAFLLTGLAALSAEVVWTRVLALVVGTTVYAFSTMLTVFLLGLAIGSAAFARVAQRSRRPGTLFGMLVVAIGLVVFASTVGFSRLPMLYMDLQHTLGQTWQGGVAVQFLLSLIIMIAPAFLMGGTFPLVARIYATDLSRVGGRIGTAYAFNTVGSILGSFIGSFVLLEMLGVEKGMLVVAVIYLVVGGVLLAAAPEGPGRRLRLAGSAVAAVAALAIWFVGPGWDEKLMTSGVYMYGPMYGDKQGLVDALKFKQLLFYDEGPGATVSVERNQTVLSLKIDGKVDASTGTDMITQELISHLPLLMHPRPDTVLVIGLGSGVSLGSAERHPVKQIDCVELLANVIDAAACYREYTYDCLADPRLNMILGDGRNHVLLTDKKYDVIISEPTNVWISGVGDLFTREFFQLARRRLKPGGVMSAWFHTYRMGDAELRSGIKTFLQVFPNTTLWLANESDLIVVATLEPAQPDQGFLARMARPEVAADLARVGVNRPADLLGALLMSAPELAAYSGAARIHTDDNMLMEFHAGRRMAEATHGVHLTNMLERMRPTRFAALDDSVNADAARHLEARRLALLGTLGRLGGRMDEALRDYDAALALAPGDPHVVSRYIEAYSQLGDAYFTRGDYEHAAASYLRVTSVPVTAATWAAYDGLGLAYLAEDRPAEAVPALETAVILNPYGSMSYLRLGDSYEALGDTAQAVVAYDRSFDLGPWNTEAANAGAWLRASWGEGLDRALVLALAATRDSRDSNCYDTLGWVYYKRGEYGQAARALERALGLKQDRVESIYHLALVRKAQGDTRESERLLRRVIELDRGGFYGLEAQRVLDQ